MSDCSGKAGIVVSKVAGVVAVGLVSVVEGMTREGWGMAGRE